jgi:hypothetical protein
MPPTPTAANATTTTRRQCRRSQPSAMPPTPPVPNAANDTRERSNLVIKVQSMNGLRWFTGRVRAILAEDAHLELCPKFQIVGRIRLDKSPEFDREHRSRDRLNMRENECQFIVKTPDAVSAFRTGRLSVPISAIGIGLFLCFDAVNGHFRPIYSVTIGS